MQPPIAGPDVIREQVPNHTNAVLVRMRSHGLKDWRDSDLNQREYCELYGLPLKRFGAPISSPKKTIISEGLLYRRRGEDRTANTSLS